MGKRCSASARKPSRSLYAAAHTLDQWSCLDMQCMNSLGLCSSRHTHCPSPCLAGREKRRSCCTGCLCSIFSWSRHHHSSCVTSRGWQCLAVVLRAAEACQNVMSLVGCWHEDQLPYRPVLPPPPPAETVLPKKTILSCASLQHHTKLTSMDHLKQSADPTGARVCV